MHGWHKMQADIGGGIVKATWQEHGAAPGVLKLDTRVLQCRDRQPDPKVVHTSHQAETPRRVPKACAGIWPQPKAGAQDR